MPYLPTPMHPFRKSAKDKEAEVLQLDKQIKYAQMQIAFFSL